MFYNLDGIEITTNPIDSLTFFDFNFNFNNIFIDIDRSNLNFFYNGKPIDSSMCDTKKFPNLFKTFMSSIHLLVLISTKSENLCPLLFLNVDLKLLSVSRISSSLIEKNIFSFQNVLNKATIDIDINSKIFQFILEVFHVDLNSNLLSPLVFKRLHVLDINGQLNVIQRDLFKSFTKLKMLRLRSQNIKKLFSRQNAWLEYLNYNVNVDIKNPIEKIY